jgi:diadenosine tetraphosphate (Ap4A) HIT family hydrolase
MFVPPKDLIVHETVHWRINQRVDARLPGYLMMAPKDPEATGFATIKPEALLEMGPVLAKVTGAVEMHLKPQHLYVGRYGHTGGHNLHFHIIPVYNWLAEAFRNDSRYRALRRYDTPGVENSGKNIGFDGAEMTLFVWREFVEARTSPRVQGPGVMDTIHLLRAALGRPQ